ncbi:MAG: DUF5320 domain-containing protein [Anaerolineae bacterium]|nr:DUF5320 domain-containing protein [Anaerolineae bacterium]
MPRGDRTGPMGMGPMTGRRAGYCAGYDAPGYAAAPFGRGFGGGWQRGWRHQYYATGMPGWARAGYGPAWGAPAYAYAAPPKDQEIEFLKVQAERLQQEMDAINQRIATLTDEA